MEWNTANDTFVRLHNVVGVVTGAPADDIIFVGNNANSTATMLQPGGKQLSPTPPPSFLLLPSLKPLPFFSLQSSLLFIHPSPSTLAIQAYCFSTFNCVKSVYDWQDPDQTQRMVYLYKGRSLHIMRSYTHDPNEQMLKLKHFS